MALTIEYVQKKYPKSKIVGLGTSMGASIMLKYAGEKGDKCGLHGIAAISAPYDLLLVSKALNNSSLFNNLSDRYLLENLINVIRFNLHIFNTLDFPINLDQVMLARSTQEFDKLFTIRVHGYRSTEQYYREASCVNYLHRITVPVLGLNSLDDPIITKDCIPYEEFLHNENLILAVTRTGGHVGWFTGLFRPRRWYAKPAIEFLNRILIENSVEIRYDLAKEIVKV